MRRNTSRRTPHAIVGISACAALGAIGPAALATDFQIPLTFNWNGLLHPGEGSNPDDLTGFRSIADRALSIDAGNANALGTLPIVGATAIRYFVVTAAGVPDCVHLGNTALSTATGTCTGCPTRWWDLTTGLNANRGVQPSWLGGLSDHLNPQTTSVTSMNLFFDANSSLGVLYHVSNGGGTFAMVLTFTDATSVTVTLGANDWFGATNPPAALTGVASQTRLANTTFTGTSNTDLPTIQTWPTQALAVTEAVVTTASLAQVGGFNANGKQLASITFQNPSQPNRGYAILAATVVTGLGPPTNDACASATVISAGATLTDNLRATGVAGPCGVADTTDVWYRYQAAATGLLEARTCGAQLDTTLAVYSVCGGGAIACNDNACGLASRAQWQAASGVTYFVRVAGNNGATGQFTFVLDTNPALHTDTTVPLAYNWNGMVHAGEDGQPDAAAGYRSISDRGFYASGASGAINAGTLVDPDLIPFSLVGQAGALDIVHLGLSGPGSPRNWDTGVPGANVNMGIQPTWLTTLDQSTPQRTDLAPLNLAMGPSTQVAVIFHISNGGGTFRATLEFADSTTAAVTLQAPDWYLDQPASPAQPGVVVQRSLGTFSATAQQDTASLGAPSLNLQEAVFSTTSLLNAGLGNVNGKRLTGLTFSNPSTTTVSNAIFAATIRDGVPDNTPVPPSGVGSAVPSPAEAGRAVLLRVAVAGGLNPPSTGLTVTVNLSTLGGSPTQAVYDDQTHGDVTGGDSIYSFAMTIPAAQAVGPYTLPFAITDAQARSGSGSIGLTINPFAWNELTDGLGDAADLPATAQACIGSGSLGGIRGTLAASDADMYRIVICDPANFSASTVGNGTAVADTQLFLFDFTGKGVTCDDDEVGGTTLQSRLTNQFIPAGAGTYFLAVSQYNKDPLDSGGALIWLDTVGGSYRVEHQPDGAGAANPVTQWNGLGATGGAYFIALTGACFVPPPCPADYDLNGRIEPADVASFVSVWFNSLINGNLAGDFDHNGAVEPADVAAFVGVWFAALTSGC